MKLPTPPRWGIVLVMLAIAFVSVVPGNMRPHLLGNDKLEHFVAYFIVGCLWAMGHPIDLLAGGVLLVIGAGSLELVQLCIPGRIASVSDFAISAMGAWMGLLVIMANRQSR